MQRLRSLGSASVGGQTGTSRSHRMLDLMRGNRHAAFAIHLVGAIAVASPLPVSANEIGGNFAWQFRGVGERTLSLQQLDLMMRRNAGGYNNFYNSTHSTYVAGDQVNCSVSATAAGNTGTSSASGSSSSPTIGNTPSILAQATGSSIASQGWPSGSAVAPLNAAQSNSSSPQSAAVSGTTSSLGVNNLQSSGGVLTQALNSQQTNNNSPQTATVAGSTACAGR